MSNPAAKHTSRLPAYTTSEQTSQAMTALAAVVANEAATRLHENYLAALDAWDCLCLAVEAVVSVMAKATALGYMVRGTCTAASGPERPYQLARNGAHIIYCRTIEEGWREAASLAHHGVHY